MGFIPLMAWLRVETLGKQSGCSLIWRRNSESSCAEHQGGTVVQRSWAHASTGEGALARGHSPDTPGEYEFAGLRGHPTVRCSESEVNTAPQKRVDGTCSSYIHVHQVTWRCPRCVWLWGNVCPAHARRATFVLRILSLAPGLSSPWEISQVDRTRPQTFSARHVA